MGQPLSHMYGVLYSDFMSWTAQTEENEIEKEPSETITQQRKLQI